MWLCAAAWPGAGQCANIQDVGIVNVSRLNMRAAPRTNAAVIKTLEKGAQVRVMDRRDGWLQVFHEGDIGYVIDQENYIALYTIHTATDSRASDLEKAKSKVKDFLKRIERQEIEIDTYNKHEKEIVLQLQETDVALNNARRQSEAISAELAKIKGEIDKTQRQADEIQKAIDKGKAYAVKRLVALYKLNNLGEMNLLASASSVHELQKSKAMVERILRFDQAFIQDMLDKKQQLSDLLAGLNEKKNNQSILEAKHKEAVHRLAQEKRKRETLLAELKSRKENSLTTLKYLKDAAATLDRTISDLSREPTNYENKSTQAFSSRRGLLNMPVKGSIISTYGTYVEPQSGATNFRKGIEIQAERGSPISAVYGGQIVYADWLKGYGNVIIITHGDNYYTVYAHAEDLFRKKGDTVEADDVIATVGDTGSMSGPTLYFEIRHHGNTEDPLKWIKKG
jgi:septal ring factor EnvC (AmiA/AmiB activator)